MRNTASGPHAVGQPNTPEREQAARVRDRAEQRYKAIRERTDLSDLGKRANIAAIHLNTKAKLADLQQSEKDRRTADLHDAETELYGLSTTPLPGAVRISVRDAHDRVASITKPGEAAALLSQAQRTNDPDLASAVAMKAADSGWRDVLSQYIGDDLDKQKALDTITAQKNYVGSPADRITSDMIFRSGTPPEVKGMSPQKLQELADQAGTTDTAPDSNDDINTFWDFLR